MSDDFHRKPFDEGTLTKLRIFELYAQEWIPVFLSSPSPKFDAVHICDFFCGPGTDCIQTYGSPLRVLDRLRKYHEQGLTGWGKVPIVVHLFDQDANKIARLRSIIDGQEWIIPNVQIDCRSLEFKDALVFHKTLLLNPRNAKLLIIEQFGVDAVTDEIFRVLIGLPITDFIFFLSSSTLHRFRNHPAIKQKIDAVGDSYDVHRVAFDYFHRLVPMNSEFYLGRFSIRKRSNIYGLIFGSHHPLGMHKFLQVAWVLPFDLMRPNKIREFESELEHALRAGEAQSEADVLRFCIQAGMTGKHSAAVLKKLKSEGVIELDFRVPDVGRFKKPRPIKNLPQKAMC
jgi:three-Cys-motif partner protein